MRYRLSELLIEYRGDRSLREMERLTGIAHTYWATLERGYDLRDHKPINPKWETLLLISKLLSLTVDQIMEEVAG